MLWSFKKHTERFEIKNIFLRNKIGSTDFF